MQVPTNSFVWRIEEIDSRTPKSSGGTHAPSPHRRPGAARTPRAPPRWDPDGRGRLFVTGTPKRCRQRRECPGALVCRRFRRRSSVAYHCRLPVSFAPPPSCFILFFLLIYPPTSVYPPARWGGLGCAVAGADKFVCMRMPGRSTHARQTHLPARTHGAHLAVAREGRLQRWGARRGSGAATGGRVVSRSRVSFFYCFWRSRVSSSVWAGKTHPPATATPTGQATVPTPCIDPPEHAGSIVVAAPRLVRPSWPNIYSLLYRIYSFCYFSYPDRTPTRRGNSPACVYMPTLCL